MARYKGKYLHTITEEDVKSMLSITKRTNGTVDFFKLYSNVGKLLPRDIGKQVYEMPSGHYQIENDEQLAKRLSLTK